MPPPPPPTLPRLPYADITSREQKVAALRSQIEDAEFRECTFVPVLPSYDTYPRKSKVAAKQDRGDEAATGAAEIEAIMSAGVALAPAPAPVLVPTADPAPAAAHAHAHAPTAAPAPVPAPVLTLLPAPEAPADGFLPLPTTLLEANVDALGGAETDLQNPNALGSAIDTFLNEAQQKAPPPPSRLPLRTPDATSRAPAPTPTAPSPAPVPPVVAPTSSAPAPAPAPAPVPPASAVFPPVTPTEIAGGSEPMGLGDGPSPRECLQASAPDGQGANTPSPAKALMPTSGPRSMRGGKKKIEGTL